MSVTHSDTPAEAAEPTPADAGAGPEPTGDGAACEGCGAPMADDQEWCLECGSARTLIHRPPDWRAPVALVAAVALLVLAGLAIALTALSAESNRDATATLASRTVTVTAPAPAPASPAPAAASRPASTSGTSTSAPPATTATTPTSPAATTTAPAAPAAAIGSWPIGLPGWTVVLASRAIEATAEAAARRYAAQGLAVGILDSSQHPSMVPGRWIVFSGRYPTRELAAAAAARLKARGYRHARARVVAPTGG